jgi:uncharacterized membrane protein
MGAFVVAGFGDSTVADGNNTRGNDAMVAGVSVVPGAHHLVVMDGELAFAVTPDIVLRSHVAVSPGEWRAVAASFDGSVARLYVDGREVAASRATTLAAAPRIEFAPVTVIRPRAGALPEAAAPPAAPHFGGSLALFTLSPTALTPEVLRTLAGDKPNFSLITFNRIGAGWPFQEHAWRGLQEPQDPWTLPRARAPAAAKAAAAVTATAVAAAVPVAEVGPSPVSAARAVAMTPVGQGVSTIGGWDLAPAPSVSADGAELSRADYQGRNWYRAVVPGTVLTTLIARGVYPDPDYGLNNLSIPESLARQDYWYRSEFVAPAVLQGHDLLLKFNGINYAAQVWLNGRRLGDIRGAFMRGSFDVTGILLPGVANAIAVRISPPPHPGIPHEQSIAAGPGNNGGALALDGPTFIATEGWDWIPGIRDRNTGIWQSVELVATGTLRIRDPHVVTHLPLPRIDTADVTLVVPIQNARSTAVTATVMARFEGVRVEKRVTLAPGVTDVTLAAAEFPQLHLAAPRLWWPNGYGSPELYSLQIDVSDGQTVSDSTSLRFGIRELSYELSLFDHEGRLRRVEVDPTLGSMQGERLVDVRHEAIKRTPRGWAESLTAAGENSPAVRAVPTESLTPYLAIRVNGVPIAARGGVLRREEGQRAIARADEPAGLPARRGEYHAGGPASAHAPQPRHLSRQSAARGARRPRRRAGRFGHHAGGAAAAGAGAGARGFGAGEADSGGLPWRNHIGQRVLAEPGRCRTAAAQYLGAPAGRDDRAAGGGRRRRGGPGRAGRRGWARGRDTHQHGQCAGAQCQDHHAGRRRPARAAGLL